MNGNNIIYFDSFGVDHIAKEIHREQKFNKYLYNTSIPFDNVWILLYWIY